MTRPPISARLPIRIDVSREGTAARAAVAEHSGVVGSAIDEVWLVLDYEANLHGSANIKTFADKVHHAAERLMSGYPTRSRTEVDEAAVIEVGRYDGKRVILDSAEREVVADWLEIAADALDDECRRSK